MHAALYHEDEDRYLSVAETVAYTSLTERTIRRKLADRVHPLPHHRVGGRVLIKRSELDRWIAEEGERTRGAVDPPSEELKARVAAAVRSLRGGNGRR